MVILGSLKACSGLPTTGGTFLLVDTAEALRANISSKSPILL